LAELEESIARLQSDLAARAPSAGAKKPAAGAATPAAPAAAPPAGSRPAVDESRGRIVLVLDDDQGWEAGGQAGDQLITLAPADAAIERVTEIGPTRMIVNLAAAGSLEAMAALRAAGSTTVFWGCLAPQGTDKAVKLGMIEPTARPLDPDAVL